VLLFLFYCHCKSMSLNAGFQVADGNGAWLEAVVDSTPINAVDRFRVEPTPTAATSPVGG
jgi:hypothetical protein